MYTCSHTEEMFNSENNRKTKKQAIEDYFKNNPEKNECFVGKVVEVTFSDFVDGDTILDDILDNAYATVGEAAEGFLENISRDHKADLEKLIIDFLEKHSDPIDFFSVIDIKTVKR